VGLAVGLARPGSLLARLGAIGALATSLITVSFLATAPGVLERHAGVPLLTLQAGQFFAKDLALVACALVALGDSSRHR